MTFNAAMATAGSLVLMPLMRGIIFSCIVYLSRALDELFVIAFAFPMPSRPSLLDAGSLEPPQSITNASNPRTFIPRLLVLVKTDEMTGNSSFLMVEKSNTGNIRGRLLNEASTILCVGDSIAKCIIGRISEHDIRQDWSRRLGRPTILEFLARTVASNFLNMVQ